MWPIHVATFGEDRNHELRTLCIALRATYKQASVSGRDQTTGRAVHCVPSQVHQSCSGDNSRWVCSTCPGSHSPSSLCGSRSSRRRRPQLRTATQSSGAAAPRVCGVQRRKRSVWWLQKRPYYTSCLRAEERGCEQSKDHSFPGLPRSSPVFPKGLPFAFPGLPRSSPVFP